jgi:phosphoadenosine phosphosulfate reductase
MTELAEKYNELLEGKSALEILDFVLENHPGKVVFSTSLGAEDQVVTHLLASLSKTSPIFTLDTGRLFPETYELIEKTSTRYEIPIKVAFPDADQVQQMVNSKGINLFYYSIENRKMCCNIRKIKPLIKSLEGFEIWVTGLRRQQSPTRTFIPIVEYHQEYNLMKVNPLLEWDEDYLWDFIRQNNIPYNTLHDKGFPSIGCQPCTRAIMSGEDVRAGRWWWEDPETKECGLHKR